ncbi:hypothetical protein J7E83_01835 [Arthrobacter sp. ISL-48]|nr:hypothetical protein [Arthrobacter sp. ISL-48]MBT2530882.1 hypothetical protein [Arthrobacter sp. ISL-48]
MRHFAQATSIAGKVLSGQVGVDLSASLGNVRRLRELFQDTPEGEHHVA